MKTSFRFIVTLLVVGFLFSNQTVEAQLLKKLKKRAGKAAEEAVIRKTEEKVYDETSKKMDTILGNDGKTNGKKPTGNSDKNPIGTNGENGNTNNGSAGDLSSDEVNIYSKFDFVPGDELLYFDDFSKDYVGDFPSKWNTNGTGEIITINDDPQKWLEFKSGYNIYYIPNLPGDLPEEFTLEFDVLVTGTDNKTSSTSHLMVILEDNNTFKDGNNYVRANIPFCQYAPIGFRLKNRINNETTINSVVRADIREAALDQPHISVAVNKQRFRLWVNEKKYVDVPQMIGNDSPMKSLKFNMNNFKDGQERLFISNLKIAKGGVDLRRKLIEEGSVSTNGILFNSGSATIKPQSYGLIRQISQVLQQEINMRLNIIGHTDADGPEEVNLALSKQRAESVKNALMTIYDISGDRLQTDGKGESVPVGDNNTPDGKAQNRRVEFVKI